VTWRTKKLKKKEEEKTKMTVPCFCDVQTSRLTGSCITLESK
jgi:hypothetical protein